MADVVDLVNRRFIGLLRDAQGARTLEDRAAALAEIERLLAFEEAPDRGLYAPQSLANVPAVRETSRPTSSAPRGQEGAADE